MSMESADVSIAYFETFGRYDSGLSGTAVSVGDTGSVTYGNEAFLSIEYYKDIVEIGGLSIAGQQL